MFSLRSFSFGLPRFVFGGSSKDDYSGLKIDIPSVEVHDIEENPEKRARTLKHLLKANHINNSIIYHHLQFHNHAPHILGSAYLLGATSDQLATIYDKEEQELERWEDSPGEISKDDWRDFLGKRNYQRAFIDFFEDRLVMHGYDWRDLVNDYLLGGKEPLINNLIAGLAHPLIHLGYAYELSSRTLAIEALAMVSCFYNKQHKYLDDPTYTKPSPFSSTSPIKILERLAEDDRFDGMFETEGEDNVLAVSEDEKKETLMLEYWNALHIDDPKTQFQDCQRAAAGLLVGTKKSDNQQYDFFIVHLLTSSHALRILLPVIPAKWHVSLLRQWWLFVVTAYIGQLRPRFDLKRIEDYDREGKEWKWVDYRAVNGKWATDAHFVKACRALKEAARTWGDSDGYFINAAVRLSEEFDGWGGFGQLSQEDTEYYASSVSFRPQ